ncbi:MAG TPA: tetratricopeptide repeat protein [Sandaracinaceae bacterium LLY-WYZ-13_1]|nr:tetratricopeptide repeat protein [Sandaracinaceae bacterium LLY-WYZ-13_1]
MSVALPRLAALSLLFSLGASIGAPTLARAQVASCDPTEEELQEAQALFIAGSAAVDSGRWADAIDSFERSYALSCRVAALYNLAMALRALGRHREARDTFDRIVRDHDDIPDDLRDTIDEFRREEAGRVAVLELVGIDGSLRPEVSFDGRRLADVAERPIVIETDAGSHSLVARIPEHQPFLWDGELSDGQRESIAVAFEPLPTGEGGIDPFVILGPILAAVAVGVAIGVGVYLHEDAQIDPLSDRLVTVERN